MSHVEVTEHERCNICNNGRCDLRINDCGCTLHARCISVNELCASSSTIHQGRDMLSFTCPSCSGSSKKGIYLFPLQLEELDEAVKLRKESILKDWIRCADKKRPREEEIEIQSVALHSEYSAAVYAHGSSIRGGAPISANGVPDLSRTGRWHDHEVAYSDHLVAAFDGGILPIPDGTKLNQFLSDILFCKASRLTKKMKNAKLSTKSYERRRKLYSRDERIKLAALEESFVRSIHPEVVQREVRFNLSKQWRSYLSNVLLQRGMPRLLEIADWTRSLEALELRATEANAAFRRDSRNKNLQGAPGGGFCPGNNKRPRRISNSSGDLSSFAIVDAAKNLHDVGLDIFDESEFQNSKTSLDSSDDIDGAFLADLLESSTDKAFSHQLHVNLAPPADIIEDSSHDSVTERDSSIAGNSTLGDSSTSTRHPRSFMEAIVQYLEDNDMPFEHADCWAPSAQSRALPVGPVGEEKVRLFHAGSVTRRDLPNQNFVSMERFGLYSESFSFGVGEGLPGHVFSTGIPLWVYDMRAPKSHVSSRINGAINFGIKTAIGVPLECFGVGRMVLVVYSHQHVEENVSLVTKMSASLAQFQPRPKWKLCIEISQPPTAYVGASHVSNSYDSSAVSPSPCAREGCSATKPIQPAFRAKSPFVSRKIFDPSEICEAKERLSSFIPTSSFGLDGETPQQITGPKDRTIQSILSLLEGQITPTPFGENAVDAYFDQATLSEMSALRFFLLTTHQGSCSNDKDLAQTLKFSYESYGKSHHKRHGSDLCRLLIQDWICLKSARNFPSTLPAISSQTKATGLPKPPPMANSTHLMLSRSQSMPGLKNLVTIFDEKPLHGQWASASAGSTIVKKPRRSSIAAFPGQSHRSQMKR